MSKIFSRFAGKQATQPTQVSLLKVQYSHLLSKVADDETLKDKLTGYTGLTG
jgi:hypothetical protein